MLIVTAVYLQEIQDAPHDTPTNGWCAMNQLMDVMVCQALLVVMTGAANVLHRWYQQLFRS